MLRNIQQGLTFMLTRSHVTASISYVHDFLEDNTDRWRDVASQMPLYCCRFIPWYLVPTNLEKISPTSESSQYYSLMETLTVILGTLRSAEPDNWSLDSTSSRRSSSCAARFLPRRRCLGGASTARRLMMQLHHEMLVIRGGGCSIGMTSWEHRVTGIGIPSASSLNTRMFN
ncbi:hypothetical protein AcW1_000326 [Taiwanofungus camphoratus]|nr:hypothetical protein AcW1_000326 [Antrodia cinnamomea]